MGHGVPVHVALQRKPEAAEQEHLIADSVLLHGLHLAALVGNESLQPGELFQQLGLLHNVFCHGAVILRRLGRILIGAGNQQRIQLGLGCGNRNHLHNVFPLGIPPDGRIAAHAVAVAHRRTHGEAVQQRRDSQLFRQYNRLLYPLYHNRKLQKMQYVCACFLETNVI